MPLLRALGLLALVATLGGCAAFPSAVTMPESNRAAGASYDTKLADLNQYIGVYPVEVSGPRIVDQASLYAGTWRKASTNLLLQRDVANNAQFGMVVAGAYNTVHSSLRAAKWWLAGAAGIGLAEERYQIEAQALQYSNGADAMECVRTAVAAIPPSLWTAYKDGALIESVPSSVQVPNESVAEVRDALIGLFGTINRRMSEIAIRVRTNLNAKKLTVPSFAEITKAVQNEQSEKKNVGDKMLGFATYRRGVAAFATKELQRRVDELDPEAQSNPRRIRNRVEQMAIETERLQEIVRQAEIPDSAFLAALLLPSKLETCVTKVGS